MDRAVFDGVEREIDDEVHKRFPCDVIKQVVLLHYSSRRETAGRNHPVRRS